MLLLGDGCPEPPVNYTLWYELAAKTPESTQHGTIAPATVRFSTATTRSSTSCRRWSVRARSAATSSCLEDPMRWLRRRRGADDNGARRVYVAQVLAELGTNYVDLLLHHVCTTRQETLLAWRVLEAALGRGQARAVGVSNFDTPDLRWLLGVAKEPVAANECHFAAGMMDDEMIRFAAAANVSLMAYGVLHGTIDPSDPAVAAVAAKHNVSAVGVLLRFVCQHNIALVTASDKRSYDVEDAALFDLTLDADDLAALRALQPGPRSCSDCYANRAELAWPPFRPPAASRGRSRGASRAWPTSRRPQSETRASAATPCSSRRRARWGFRRAGTQ